MKMSNVREASLLCLVSLVILGSFTFQASAASKAKPTNPIVEENAREQANIATVMAFYKGLANFDFDECRKYMGDYYVQHNPTVEDGLEGLKKALSSMRKVLGPKARFNVDHKLIVADGDHVIVLSHSVLASDDILGNDLPNRGSAVADIFRLENGKIVEHWDTIEAVPEKVRNSNGVF